jgi:hypothetical protein
MMYDMKRKGVVTSKTRAVSSAKSRRKRAVKGRAALRFKESGNVPAIARLRGIAKGLGLPPNVERDPDREIE